MGGIVDTQGDAGVLREGEVDGSGVVLVVAVRTEGVRCVAHIGDSHAVVHGEGAMGSVDIVLPATAAVGVGHIRLDLAGAIDDGGGVPICRPGAIGLASGIANEPGAVGADPAEVIVVVVIEGVVLRLSGD